jgi:transaldolase/glucose-6-phosphate isomerase
VILGAIMGAAAQHGRDKLTIITSPGIASLGAWLEQLLAESTGKLGRGIVPIDAEPMGAPAVYGADRLFAYLRLQSDPDGEQETQVAALEATGQPMVRITLSDPMQLGQEFFRWEMATAVAGAMLAINPFDQPDVEAQKIKTRELTSAYEKSGALPPETPLLVADGIALFADPASAGTIKAATTLAGALKAHFDRAGAGDYVALLAYIDRNPAHTDALQQIRRIIRDRLRTATCLGFGPRFLHSTGQVYKGGPNSGVVLQITCEDASDLAVPGQAYSFGIVKAAQARGDFDVLAERGRRLLRVHLPADLEAGLKTLGEALEQALR